MPYINTLQSSFFSEMSRSRKFFFQNFAMNIMSIDIFVEKASEKLNTFKTFESRRISFEASFEAVVY